MAAEVMLSAEAIGFAYGPHAQVLHRVDLEIRKQDVLVLLGLSGSGKSTLLKILCGLAQPTSGKLVLRDQRIDQMSEVNRLDFLRREVGHLYQQGGLLSNLTVYDNVALPLRYFGSMAQSQVDARVMSLLEQFGLSEVANRRPATLSIGQQKMVSFAQLQTRNPSILFLDEPTASIDTHAAEQIMEAIKLYNILGGTVVAITHDMFFARAMAGSLAVIDRGSILTHGSPFHVATSTDDRVQKVIRSLGRDAQLAEEILKFFIRKPSDDATEVVHQLSEV